MSDDLRFPVFRLMRKYGIPITRERYLYLNYMGRPPKQLDAEQEEELPPQLRRRERPRRRQ